MVMEAQHVEATPGAAYVFDATGALLATLDNPAPSEDDEFGFSVAIDGDLAAVGVALEDPGGVLNAGAAFAFDAGLGATLTGMDVAVAPAPVDDNGDPILDAPVVDLKFDDVTLAGETTVTITEGGPPPPSGFKLIGLTGGPIYFDVETTAVFEGFVKICIDYSEFTVGGDPAKLAFAHDDGTGWDDIGTSTDTVNKIICGTTDEFSFFAIVENADPVELLADLVEAVAALNAKKSIINSLDAKLDAAEKALAEAIDQNDHTAINVLVSAFINSVEAQRGKELSDAEADNLIGRADEIILVLAGGASL